MKVKQVNRSGFTFQLKVEHDIRAAEQSHHWSVASREHPWTTEENSGFIDIVLKHKQYSTFRLAIECKRVKSDDERQTRSLFLVPDPKSSEVVMASCLEVESDLNNAKVWDNVRVWPASYQSEFCVLQGDEPKRLPLLEALAKGLLEQVEGLAQEEISIQESIDQPHLRLFLFPMIVTNAKIVICRFDPVNVSLEQGVLQDEHADIFEVPFLRFRKSLATGFPKGRPFYTLTGQIGPANAQCWL